jgi:hypothetical protein
MLAAVFLCLRESRGFGGRDSLEALPRLAGNGYERGRRRQGLQRFGVRGARDTPFAENCRDVPRGRHVERRMCGVHIRSNTYALEMRDFR